MLLTRDAVRKAALGGAFLGGGGGGSMDEGIALGELAIAVGEPRLVNLADLKPDDLIVTVSAVGAPAAKDQYVKPADFVVALKAINDRLGGKVAGLITSENGGLATLNGWFQSAMTGIPVVDAACNGRAHPTGVMGSMGLDTRPDYHSVMAAVGGDPAKGRRLQIVAEGALGVVDRMVRQAAVEAGGMVAVARNPVPAAYVKENGAPGAISLALELGGIIDETRSKGGRAVAAALVDRLGGTILTEGTVTGYHLETTGGYDVGRLEVEDVRLTFWNEYMTADRNGQRLATFPDLIATISVDTGLPVSSAMIGNGQRVVVVAVPKTRLILGAGVRRAETLRPVEAVLGEELVRYF
ncbi:MAG TPA: DUF917 family protein [Symbiobacteriaceae bacterium]